MKKEAGQAEPTNGETVKDEKQELKAYPANGCKTASGIVRAGGEKK